MSDPFSTHDVTNQPPPFEDVNLFTSDAALQDAVVREGGGHALKQLNAFGLVTGSAEAFQRGRIANENPAPMSCAPPAATWPPRWRPDTAAR